jgi:hypothetical protein
MIPTVIVGETFGSMIYFKYSNGVNSLDSFVNKKNSNNFDLFH